MDRIRRIIMTAMLLALWFTECLSTSIRADTNRSYLGQHQQQAYNRPHGTTNDKNDDCYQTISKEKLCDGFFDCPDGSDEICTSKECPNTNQCQCTHTKKCVQLTKSHFYPVYKYRSSAQPHLSPKQGFPIMLECPIFNAEHIKRVNWYRNNAAIPSKCQITPPTNSTRIARLFCSDMQNSDNGVYTCEENYAPAYRNTDFIVTVGNKQISNMDSCFCFGATTKCQLATVSHQYKQSRLFSDSLSYIFVETNDQRKTVVSNYKIVKNRTPTSNSLNADVVYYALSETITSKKLELYGGWFTYKIQPLSQELSFKDGITPIAVMRGSGRVLVYKSGDENKNSHWKRLSFFKTNWHVVKRNHVSEEKASEEDIMMVLNNLEGIYVRARSVYDHDRDGEYMLVDLYTMKFKSNGVPSIFQKCSCPPGYAGNYCEKCDTYYFRDPRSKIYCHQLIGRYDPPVALQKSRTMNDNHDYSRVFPTGNDGIYDDDNDGKSE